MGKVIPLELCKWLRFVYRKEYESKPKTAPEKKKRNIQRDFNIQADHRVKAKRPDLITLKINKYINK